MLCALTGGSEPGSPQMSAHSLLSLRTATILAWRAVYHRMGAALLAVAGMLAGRDRRVETGSLHTSCPGLAFVRKIESGWLPPP